MARSRSGFQHRSQTRRETEWNVGTGGTGLTSAGASSVQFLGSNLAPIASGLTLIRTRGLLDIFIDGAPTTDGDGYFGAFGIAVVTAASVAAGITAVPTPITEQGWDGWLYHNFFSVHAGDVSLAPYSSSHQRIEVDSKAMRKFPLETLMYASLEVVEIGAATLNVFWDSRVLFKLS